MAHKSTPVNYEGLISIEQPFIKVPIEGLKKAIRNSQKIIEKELLNLPASLAELYNSPNRSESLKQIKKRVENLKRKYIENKELEAEYIQKTRARIDHIALLTKIDYIESDEYTRWSQTRLDRVLVDYLLRSGFETTALSLIKDANISSLVDYDIFAHAKKIQISLESRSCTDALQWCSENKTNLKKIKSNLEFKLRLQEFIELIREKKTLEAIAYSKKFLVSWSDTHLKEIQQATALLAFNPHKNFNFYQSFFQESRWTALVNLFKQNTYALNALPNQSLLKSTLQAGLSSLKTPNCYHPEDKNIKCPCCQPLFSTLAKKLPNSHHMNSFLVCRLSGEIIDAYNPPLVLPNGFVYSTRALLKMANENKGSIVCPRSGAIYHHTQTRKAFIL